MSQLCFRDAILGSLLSAPRQLELQNHHSCFCARLLTRACAGPECVDEVLSDVNRTYTGFYAVKRVPRDQNAQVVRKVLQMGAYGFDVGKYVRKARAEAEVGSNQAPLERRPASTGRRLREGPADAAAPSRCSVKEQGWSRNIPSRDSVV